MLSSQPKAERGCLAAVFHSPAEPLELQRLPIPDLRPGEILVKIECCTICGSDLHTLAGRREEVTPTILGHEALGTIVALGPTDAQVGHGVGERVTWSVAASCFQCARCRQGLPQKCERLFKYGHALARGRTALSGGLAEYILLQPGSTLVSLPPQADARVFCPANCATATIVACFRKAGSVQGQRVLIYGAGLLGLTAAALAAMRGAEAITVVEPEPQRGELARQFGATHLWQALPAEEHGKFDVVFEVSGAGAAMLSAMQAADLGGRIIFAGAVSPTEPLALDPQALVRSCATLAGVHNYTPADLIDAVSFLADAQERFPFRSLVAQAYDLGDVVEALQFAETRRPIRVAVYT